MPSLRVLCTQVLLTLDGRPRLPARPPPLLPRAAAPPPREAPATQEANDADALHLSGPQGRYML